MLQLFVLVRISNCQHGQNVSWTTTWVVSHSETLLCSLKKLSFETCLHTESGWTNFASVYHIWLRNLLHFTPLNVQHSVKSNHVVI